MPQTDTNQSRPVHEAIAAVFLQSKVGLAVYLPDSVLYALAASLEAEPAISTVVCTREDEGVAIASGASLAGGLSVVLMEGSGVGYCGLILARAQIQRSGFLLVASHSPALGEAHDYHASSRLAGAGVLGGLGIPYVVPTSRTELLTAVAEGLVTVRGQRSVVGVLVPPYLMSDR